MPRALHGIVPPGQVLERTGWSSSAATADMVVRPCAARVLAFCFVKRVLVIIGLIIPVPVEDAPAGQITILAVMRSLVHVLPEVVAYGRVGNPLSDGPIGQCIVEVAHAFHEGVV